MIVAWYRPILDVGQGPRSMPLTQVVDKDEDPKLLNDILEALERQSKGV